MPTRDSITLIAFRFLNSVAAVTAISSELQRREIIELLQDAGVPLTNLFLTIMVKVVSLGPPRMGE